MEIESTNTQTRKIRVKTIKMKATDQTIIMHVILSLEIGGMEQVAADLVRNLDKSRFKPVVVCINELGSLGEELLAEGFTVIRLKRMIPILSFLFPFELIKVIRRYRPDVIHVHCGCWHKAAMAGWLTGVNNIIYTDHGRLFPDSWKTILLDRIFSRVTHHIVAVSESIADYLHGVVGLDRQKISVIINGIDVFRFKSSSRSIPVLAQRIGIIARLAPVKDIGTLIKAMQLVIGACPDSHLEVVGDGQERAMLEKVTQNLDIASSVTFHGFRRDIPEVLREIDIFVLSSLSEGTSITLLEAMASGKPVVVSNVGGNPAIVEHGLNGFLVPSGDHVAMAAAIIRLLSDGDLRKRMSEANVRVVEQRYSLRTMTEQYEKLYTVS